MPRPLRIQYPNATYHVMNRGAGRQKIFKNNLHRVIFLNLLEECTKMFKVKIYAYCLMDNHYHLLLSTPDGNLSRIMRHINGVYTQKFNMTSNTDGPLFRGRYKAQLIEDDSYQLYASRYIHLNPVEARLTLQPADYKWSSYCAYLGLVTVPAWLSVEVIMNQLTETKSLSTIKNYQDYVEQKDIEEINIFSGNKFTTPIVGSETLKNKILSNINSATALACSPDIKRIKAVPEIESIIDIVCTYYCINRQLLASSKTGVNNWPRTVCIYLCRKEYGHSMRSIAQFTGFQRSESVSTAVRKCQSLLQKDPMLHDEINKIITRINEKTLKQKARD